ncbi:MAG: chemotaxis-specific protein-glutamate methyltransferase CheB [Proteobacteria bacterium]|nr:chemotaxis-specific protein-glutamate methyltransferase CheB [Pseudomonadota bacterium]MBU4356816.1 chemotaxis-specific protein-glutamate methyltransferase CheB [Pseudomonadota bacterium]MBU4448509.1 chemotaxis-specific protein-glutamate methyltransferase CheB [Pseudomonadota bacterium]MCG2772318.1 chemotaxis-specific protein-glutamate methyltransferase CheB [Desulfobacterales bacterium]
MDKLIRVLVVDDSAYVRKVMTQMLSRSPFIEVVGAARDGAEALELVEQLNPDVVTLDLIMPEMDGVEFMRRQMARRPLPVVVVSIASESGGAALAALEAGAIDFVQKPTALATEKIFEISNEIIDKVKAASQASLAPLQRLPSAAPAVALPAVPQGLLDLVVIGISTGGPQALKYLIPQLPANFPAPVAIVLHMPVGYTALYAEKLNEVSNLHVVEAGQGQEVRPGTVFIAPAGRHLTLVRRADGVVATHLDARPFDTPHRPSVDVLFQSAANVFRERLLGVVMTGMGADGREGAAWIKSQGGLVYTESEESCVIYGMPRSVAEANLSDRSIPLDRMALAIMEVV